MLLNRSKDASVKPPPRTRLDTTAELSRSGPSDLRLVEAAIAGDAQARDDFARRMRCVPAILRQLDGRFGKKLRGDQLQDLVQDTLLQIWRKVSTFNGRSSLETWAYGFCILQSRNFHRRQQRLTRVSEQLAATAHEPESADADAPLRARELHRALARLPERVARTLHARHFLHLSFEQIGENHREPTNTSKTRYYRGLRQLRRLLDGGLGDGA